MVVNDEIEELKNRLKKLLKHREKNAEEEEKQIRRLRGELEKVNSETKLYEDKTLKSNAELEEMRHQIEKKTSQAKNEKVNSQGDVSNQDEPKEAASKPKLTRKQIVNQGKVRRKEELNLKKGRKQETVTKESSENAERQSTVKGAKNIKRVRRLKEAQRQWKQQSKLTEPALRRLHEAVPDDIDEASQDYKDNSGPVTGEESLEKTGEANEEEKQSTGTLLASAGIFACIGLAATMWYLRG